MDNKVWKLEKKPIENSDNFEKNSKISLHLESNNFSCCNKAAGKHTTSYKHHLKIQHGNTI